MSRLAREIKFYTSRVPGGLKTLAIDESIIKGLEDDRLFTSSELKSMMTELMSGGYSEEPYQLMLFTQKLQVSMVVLLLSWHHKIYFAAELVEMMPIGCSVIHTGFSFDEQVVPELRFRECAGRPATATVRPISILGEASRLCPQSHR